MRSCVWLALLVASSASADDTAPADDTTIRMRRLAEPTDEPWLHLDAMAPNPAAAEGGLMDGRAASLDLGPRAHLAAEGTWWQTGLAPSMFADDLRNHGWRIGAELSYDLGLFSVGVNASMTRDGDSAHRMVGLFAFRTFRLSRWMRAWIMLGVGAEQWEGGPFSAPRQGTMVGLTLGTTFR